MRVALICALPGVPGPGIAMILIGLLILSDHFTWAAKMLGWVRGKARSTGVPEWALLDRSTESGREGMRPSGDRRASQREGEAG